MFIKQIAGSLSHARTHEGNLHGTRGGERLVAREIVTEEPTVRTALTVATICRRAGGAYIQNYVCATRELMPGLTMQFYGKPSVNNVGARVGVMSAGQAFPDANRPVHYYAPINYRPNP
jgi:hypothetical protein